MASFLENRIGTGLKYSPMAFLVFADRLGNFNGAAVENVAIVNSNIARMFISLLLGSSFPRLQIHLHQSSAKR